MQGLLCKPVVHIWFDASEDLSAYATGLSAPRDTKKRDGSSKKGKIKLIKKKSCDRLHFPICIDRSNGIDPSEEEKSGTEADEQCRYRLNCYQLERSPESPILVFTHTHIFSQMALPSKILIVGGGVFGCECLEQSWKPSVYTACYATHYTSTY